MSFQQARPAGDIPGWDIFAAEVLRWNAQFSLISRTSPEEQLRLLLSECRASFPVLIESLRAVFPVVGDSESSPRPDIVLIDLGSGGGFPGIPWALQMRDHFSRADDNSSWSAHLVEPRQKRAWFLERCSRKLGLENVEVVESRWGDVGDTGLASSAPPASGRLWIISLKALKLTESEVWRGFRRFVGRDELLPGESVAICRFHSGVEKDLADTISELALPPRVESLSSPSRRGATFVAPFADEERSLALLLSCYGGIATPA